MRKSLMEGVNLRHDLREEASVDTGCGTDVFVPVCFLFHHLIRVFCIVFAGSPVFVGAGLLTFDCCCDNARDEYLISNAAPGAPELWAIRETTGTCCRIWCPSKCKRFDLVTNDEAETLIARFEHCCGPVAPCKCCCMEEMSVYDANGKDLGSAREKRCWCPWKQPELLILKPGLLGDVEYTLDVNGTCCCCLKKWTPPGRPRPVSIMDPDSLVDKLTHTEKGRMTVLQGAVELRLTGQLAMIYPDVLAYQVKIPLGATPDAKARILASAILCIYAKLM